MELTEQQKRKLLSAAEIVDKGDMAVLERLLEFEDLMQGNTDKINETVDKAEEDITFLSEKLTSEIEDKLSNIRDGAKGESGVDGKDGKDGRDGRDGRNGVDGVDGRDGKDGKDGVDGKDGSPDTPDMVVDKVNSSTKLIRSDKIAGWDDLKRIATQNATALPITTSIINGYRAKNFNFVGATVSIQGDTATVTTSSGLIVTEVDGAPSVSNPTQIKFSNGSVTDNGDGTVTVTTGSGGGGDVSSNTATSVDSEVALFSGTGGKTIKRATGTGFAKLTSGVLSVVEAINVETPSGTVDGSNVTFTVTVTPKFIVSDGAVYFDGAGYSLATLTVTMTVPPVGFIRSIY